MAQYLLAPAAVLDFAEDWSPWLAAGETITAHTATATPGATVDSSSESAGKVTFWLSGGVRDATVHVAVHITTSAGRQDTRTATILVRDR